jgi:hypothetical protein
VTQQDCYIEGWLDAEMPAWAEIGSDVIVCTPTRTLLPPRHLGTHRDCLSHGEAEPRVQHGPIWHAPARVDRLGADSPTAKQQPPYNDSRHSAPPSPERSGGLAGPTISVGNDIG